MNSVTFTEPRLGISVNNPADQVEAKLDALEAYQLSLAAPAPPSGSFNAWTAERGRMVFESRAQCATCHSGSSSRMRIPGFTIRPESPWIRPMPSAARPGCIGHAAPGIVQHPPYFHDGSAATLADVVERYDAAGGLGLTAAEKTDLVEYLKSL